jgi:uncharacterized coiled-coil protein SlyX
MEVEPFISPVVTIIIAVVTAYIATNANNSHRFEELKVQNAEQTTMLKALKEQVEKHNGVIERTYLLESSMKTAFHRIDELRDADEKLAEKIERSHG